MIPAASRLAMRRYRRPPDPEEAALSPAWNQFPIVQKRTDDELSSKPRVSQGIDDHRSAPCSAFEAIVTACGDEIIAERWAVPDGHPIAQSEEIVGGRDRLGRDEPRHGDAAAGDDDFTAGRDRFEGVAQIGAQGADGHTHKACSADVYMVMCTY